MHTIYDLSEVEKLRSQNAVQPHAMKQFKNALFKKAESREAALRLLPEKARSGFRTNLHFEPLELAERHDSAIDGASKLIFKTADNHLIESVILRPKTGRTSLCISSQIGCACRCQFCATGQMGFIRNLTVAEIVDQVTQAARLVKPEGRTIRNVVFMGMGEPLLNQEQVSSAVEFLTEVTLFNLSPARITVSTVGIPAAMESFSARFPEVQLALSLHSARQEVREKLIPQARKYPLEILQQTLRNISHHGKVMIEYLMLEGLSDTDADLQALMTFLEGIPAHINLIPYNTCAGSELKGTSQPERERFGAQLKSAGFDTTLRYSLGADIEAACGQLVKHKREESYGTG